MPGSPFRRRVMGPSAYVLKWGLSQSRFILV